MDGVLVIDKPVNMTSHDVVAEVKKKLKASKVGHLGTLDPNATGVLPLVINRATKLASFLGGTKKAYSATMKLGEETDTYDVEGEVTASAGIEGITALDVTSALRGFTGKIKQIPPMFSAVKCKGTPLYKLARKGIVVEREPKEIEIYSIEIVDISLPYVIFNVECSTGTYIRTLCHDLGVVLNCGAYLSALRRTLSGPFTIDEALPLAQDIEGMRASIIPVDIALARLYKGVSLTHETAGKIIRGASMVGIGEHPPLEAGEILRLTLNDETLLALAEYGDDGIFKVLKHFGNSSKKSPQRLRANSRHI